MRTLSVLVLAAALAFAAPNTRAQERQEQRSAGPAPVYLSLRYGRLSDVFVAARYGYEQKAFYLSLADLFSALKLDYHFNPAGPTVTGFYLDPEQRYRLAFGAGTATFNGKTYAIDSTAYAATALNVFVRPHVLERIFGLKVEAHMRSLSITLDAPTPLPVDRLYQRRQRRASLKGAPDGRRPKAPLLYPRERALFDGGVLGYSVGASYDVGGPLGGSRARLHFNTSFGAEVYGGGLRGTVRGFYSKQAAALDVDNLRYRYALAGSPVGTQIVAGALRSGGRRFGTSFHGVRLTNEPVRLKRLRTTYVIDGQTQPKWDVELYVDGQLTAVTTADALGRYAFEAPLTYGTTFVTLKFYGPNGQYREEKRRFQVPYTFVPAGDVYYRLEAGQPQRGGGFGRLNVAVGLAPWLSGEVGLTYVNGPGRTTSPARPSRAALHPFTRLSARLGGGYILGLHAAPGVAYGGRLDAFYSSLASFSLFYEYARAHAFYNRANLRHEVAAQADLPIRLGATSLYLRAGARMLRYASGRTRYRLTPSVTARWPGGLRTRLSYRGRLRDGVGGTMLQASTFTVDVGYIFSYRGNLPAPLRGMLLSASFGYDAERGRPSAARLDLSRNLFGAGRVQVSLGRDFGNAFVEGYTTARVELTLDLPFARTSTQVRTGPGGARFAQRISGAVGYDARFNRLLPVQRDWVGQAAVSLRMFVDYNGNGRYDDGEHAIDEADLRFGQATATRRSESGIIRVFSLRPYRRYRVQIVESSIENPLWVPAQPVFSFVADPNQYKTIDVPFYAAGVLTGTVLRRQSGTLTPVSGLRLQLRQLDGGYERTIPVFSDGAFYAMGLPPGEYVLKVDPDQLDILEAVAEPSVHRFTVEPTRRGDYVTGIDFVLHARSEGR